MNNLEQDAEQAMSGGGGNMGGGNQQQQGGNSGMDKEVNSGEFLCSVLGDGVIVRKMDSWANGWLIGV